MFHELLNFAFGSYILIKNLKEIDTVCLKVVSDSPWIQFPYLLVVFLFVRGFLLT